jgi:hypothetical protein
MNVFLMHGGERHFCHQEIACEYHYQRRFFLNTLAHSPRSDVSYPCVRLSFETPDTCRPVSQAHGTSWAEPGKTTKALH